MGYLVECQLAFGLVFGSSGLQVWLYWRVCNSTEPFASHATSVPHVFQVLVITHNLASMEETMPYHSVRLFPAPVLELFGRSAAEYPQIKKQEAVFYVWKDFSFPQSKIHGFIGMHWSTLGVMP